MQCHQHAAGPIAIARDLLLQSGLEVGTVGHSHGSGPILKLDPTVGRFQLENTFQVMKVDDLTMEVTEMHGSHYRS